MLLLAAVLYFTGRLGLILSEFADAWPLWPPAGIAAGALTIGGLSLWPGVAIGTFALAISAPIDLPQVELWTVLATLESVAIAALARRWLHDSREATFTGLLPLLAVIAPTVTGMFAAAGTLGGGAVGIVASNKAVGYWLYAWMSSLTGVLVFMPAVIAITRPSAMIRNRSRFGTIEGIGLIAGLMAVSAYGYFGDAAYDLALASPFVAWVAYRFRERGAALAVLLVVGVSVMGRVSAVGPIDDGVATMLLHSGAIGGLALSGYLFGFRRVEMAVVEQVREPPTATARAVAEGAPVAIFGLREVDGEGPVVTYVSSGIHQLFGVGSEVDGRDVQGDGRPGDARVELLVRLVSRVTAPDRGAGRLSIDEELPTPERGVGTWARIVATVADRGAGAREWRGVLVDATESRRERQQTREALHRSRARERQAGLVPWEWRRSGRRFNVDEQRLRDLVGIDQDQPCDPLRVAQLLVGGRESSRAALVRMVRRREPIAFVVAVHAEDGTTRHVDVYAEGEWSRPDRMVRVFGYLRDVTSSTRRDAQVVRLGHKIRAVRRQRALGRAAGVVCGDLREQIQAILTRSDTALRSLGDAPDSRYADALSEDLIEAHAATRRAMHLTARLNQWVSRSREHGSTPLPEAGAPRAERVTTEPSVSTPERSAPPSPSSVETPPRERERAASHTAVAATDAGRPSRGTVVVMSSERRSRAHVESILVEAGHRVIEASDPTSAMAVLRERRVDAVVAHGDPGRALFRAIEEGHDAIAMVLIDELDASVSPVSTAEGWITVVAPPPGPLLCVALDRALEANQEPA